MLQGSLFIWYNALKKRPHSGNTKTYSAKGKRAMSESNYDVMKENARNLFLTYGQEKMISKFSLRHDQDYLYLFFAGRDYRVSREQGFCEWSEDSFRTACPGDFHEAMTLYDILCYSKDTCRPSGNFCKIDRVRGATRVASSPDGSLFNSYGEYFGSNPSALARACETLGGSPYGKGDVSYRLPLFVFTDPKASGCAAPPAPGAEPLMVMVELWEADDEFPASLNLFWDDYILDYMHFETTFYAAGHLLGRLKEIVQNH